MRQNQQADSQRISAAALRTTKSIVLRVECEPRILGLLTAIGIEAVPARALFRGSIVRYGESRHWFYLWSGVKNGIESDRCR